MPAINSNYDISMLGKIVLRKIAAREGLTLYLLTWRIW
jgi:hypothetical protein